MTLLGPGLVGCSLAAGLVYTCRAFLAATSRTSSVATFVALASCAAYFGWVGGVANWRLIPTNSSQAMMTVTGHVLHADGTRAQKYAVATYWSANGVVWDEYGNYAFPSWDGWRNEGQMEPLPRDTALALPNGCFRLQCPPASWTLLAMSEDRSTGGIVAINSNTEFPVPIRVEPLIHLLGTVDLAMDAQRHAAVRVIEVSVYPATESGIGRFTACTSSNGRFSFRLPPGVYDLGASSSDANQRRWTRQTLVVTSSAGISRCPIDERRVRVKVPRGVQSVDVGALHLK